MALRVGEKLKSGCIKKGVIMLTVQEIKQFIDNDAASEKKRLARVGDAYYNSDHDIKNYRIFYFNKEGKLVEDKTRSNVKIPHPFFVELVDQAVQYILSGEKGFVRSDIPELQAEMDARFNENEDFKSELSEVLTDCQAKGFAYMSAYMGEEMKLAFKCADSLGVIEVEARFASDKKEHIIYWYIDREDKDGKTIKRIMDWDAEKVYLYKQTDNGNIEPDNIINGKNEKPHFTYQEGNKTDVFYDTFGFVPFFRLDNNKKQHSSLRPVKPLIDDYDLHASSLTNNLVDFDTPLYAVKGFDGDNLDELGVNLKSRKIVGLPEEGGIDVKTVDVPYQARKEKLELDEKNIYRFGMGLNTAGLKDTNATTNIAIKAAYSLLDLKCSKLEIRLKQFMQKIVKVVLDEINKANKTDYQLNQVYFRFEHEIMSNAEENARIKLTEAQARQAEITTLLNLAAQLDNETLMELICEQLDIDYKDIKDKLPDPDEAENAVADAQAGLNGVVVEDESQAEGSSAGIS